MFTAKVLIQQPTLMCAGFRFIEYCPLYSLNLCWISYVTKTCELTMADVRSYTVWFYCCTHVRYVINLSKRKWGTYLSPVQQKLVSFLRLLFKRDSSDSYVIIVNYWLVSLNLLAYWQALHINTVYVHCQHLACLQFQFVCWLWSL